MGVASGCGEQEVGVASGSGWNLWVWLLGVVLRRYIRVQNCRQPSANFLPFNEIGRSKLLTNGCMSDRINCVST